MRQFAFSSAAATILFLTTLTLPILALASSRNSPSSKAILLSSVRTLTLRAEKQTSHRRVPTIPQLRCSGGNACDLYAVDTMRCVNQGADYDDENIQWTCVANLPEEFKLGSTEVICEGFRNAEDDWVLKGSCGVEYRLLLTDKGEQTYGKRKSIDVDDRTWGEWFWDLVNMLKVIGIVLVAFFLLLMLLGWLFPDRQGSLTGGGNGWGGGGGGDGPDDPPPPYDWKPSRKQYSSFSSSRPIGGRGSRGWEPGFWTGALSGAAATYAINRAQNRGNGEGSSRSTGSGGGSSSYTSETRESTGFGGTSRR